MGGEYTPPASEGTASMLNAYSQYLPGIISETAAQQPGVAGQQLAATQATQPAYNALNLDQAQQFAVPLAQVGQQVTNSNALAGAKTNLDQINGAGGDAATAATALNRATNPDYYAAQDAASKGAASAVNAINLNGLSPGENNAVERANNQNLSGTGNLGLNNNTNYIANALNFGGAFNSKIPLMNSAVGSASGAASTAASNGGVNPVNIALGQPNQSTAGNFGTGTFTNTTPSTQNSSASNTFGAGSSLLSGITSNTNAQIGYSTGLGEANATAQYVPNVSC